MLEKFGPVLIRWRNKSALSQAKLADLLITGLDTRHKYTKSDISKWENDWRIPSETIVEQLEKILDTPEGVLFNAAGYKNAVKYRRPDLQRQQMQHEAELLSIVRQAYQYLPGEPDKCADLEEVKSAQLALYNSYQVLLANPWWPSLATHLGDDPVDEFNEMIMKMQPGPFIGTLIPDELSEKDYRSLIQEAWILIYCKLHIPTLYGIYKKKTCPWCPIQKSDLSKSSD